MRLFQRKFLLWRSLFAVIMLLLLVAAVIGFSLPARYAVLIFIGSLLLGMLLFRNKPEKDFQQSVIRILQSYENYLIALKNNFLQHEVDLVAPRTRVEEAMRYAPHWVYKVGFEARLREGYRHFLIRVEQLGEILFALHALLRKPYDKNDFLVLASEIEIICEQSCRLIQVLVSLLSLEKPAVVIEDWIDAIDAMRKKVAEFGLGDSALTVLHQSYVYPLMLIQDFSDLREILLKMAQAIR